MDVDIPEIDPNFEPQARGRSNTWPLRPRELTKEEETGTTQSPKSTEGEPGVDTPPRGDPLGLASKKTSSRRNAWGNLSYADLITKAIDSSPEKRLTLSQIYDWMVQNVPYFKDKGDSNSSAGWKNSIRHNLSLHSRFMRVQNEGTGKSSWWVLNPDAKPGKTPRRRATSMDTKAYEKKRGRVKKKVDALRAAAEGHSNPGSEFGDSASELNLPDTFSLSPQDFRARTSSNASSIGRLSPIQSALEPDLHDKQVPPISPIPWQQGSLNASPYSGQDGFTETLSESLAEMFVGDMNNLSSDPSTNDGGMSMNSSTSLSMSNSSPLQPQLSPNNNFQGTDGFLPAPPPYQDSRRRSPQGGQGQQQQLSPNNLTQLGQQSGMGQGVMNVRQNMSLGPANMGQGNNMCENVMNQQTTMDTGVMSTLGAMLESPVTVNNSHQSISSGNMSSMSMRNGLNHGGQQGPAQPGQPRFMAQTLSELLASDNDAMMADSTPRTFSSGGGAFQQQQQQQQQSSPIASNSQLSRQQQILGMSSSLLRQALTKKQALQARLAQQQQQQHQQQQLQQMQQLSQLHGITNHHLTQLAMTHGGNHMSLGANSGQGHGGGLGGLPRLPSDLELMNYDMKPAELDCDVNEIIKHELSFDDTLDFNFSEPPPPQDMTGSTSGVDQFNNPLQT